MVTAKRQTDHPKGGVSNCLEVSLENKPWAPNVDLFPPT